MAQYIDKRRGKKQYEGQKPPALVGETLAEYFHPDKAHKEVRRGELASLLVRYRQAEIARRWYRRWWLWVKRKIRGGVDLVDFLKVVGKEEEAVRAVAKDANVEAKPL